MDKMNKLIKFQQKRDELNKEIEKQFNIIIMGDYTLEERKTAAAKHKELIEEYKELGKLLK